MSPPRKRLTILLAAVVGLAVAAPLGATANAATATTNANANANANATRAERPDSARRLRQVAYFIQWGIYGRSYFVKNVDTSGAAAKLTHLNYAFAGVGPDTS